MNKSCNFDVIGRCKVPDYWNNNHESKINRLYYIHSGTGGYIKNGERVEYVHKRLYLLPAFAGIYTYSSLTDKIDHTYASFELIPPVMTKDVLSIDPHAKPEVESALGVFISLCNRKLADKDKRMKEYLAHTVIYLINKIAEENDSTVLKDQILIKSLELMHTNLHKNISISEIAEECNMSLDGFIRKFKAAFDQTPYNYLKELKLRTALKYRELGNSWDEIAQMCGYADQTSLLHAIKNRK